MYFGVSQKIHSSRYLYIIENSAVHMELALLSIQSGRSKLQIVENSKCQYIEKNMRCFATFECFEYSTNEPAPYKQNSQRTPKCYFGIKSIQKVFQI